MTDDLTKERNGYLTEKKKKKGMGKVGFLFLFFFFFLGEKPLLVPTFLGDFHFSPYILFLLFLVPILKNASRFGSYHYIKNGEI